MNPKKERSNWKKFRINIYLEGRDLNTLHRVADSSNNSSSAIITALIRQYLTDPVERLTTENKEFAQRIYDNQKKIEELQKYQAEKQIKVEVQNDWDNEA